MLELCFVCYNTSLLIVSSGQAYFLLGPVLSSDYIRVKEFLHCSAVIVI